MTKQQLYEQICRKQSFLCVGLDTDIHKIPAHLLDEEDPVFTFNKAIIDATADLCVAYKPNLAFYECNGIKGWQALEKTVRYIRENHPEQFLIADAKRGDIGNTSEMYASSFFRELPFDAVTVAPYMIIFIEQQIIVAVTHYRHNAQIRLKAGAVTQSSFFSRQFGQTVFQFKVNIKGSI